MRNSLLVFVFTVGCVEVSLKDTGGESDGGGIDLGGGGDGAANFAVLCRESNLAAFGSVGSL